MKKGNLSSDVAIIIPVYNEGKVISGVLDNVRKVYQNVVCVNDGSKDDSLQKILSANVYCINHPINMGQGAAIQTGIEYALQNKDIKYFVTFDADGQHRIEDVIGMVDEIKASGADIILGSRFLGKAVNMRLSKRLVLRVAISFSNLTSGVKLTDTHNGLRVFNRRAAQALQLEMSDYSHASEIIERVAQKKLKYSEYPVTIVYTEYSTKKGQSMLNAINIAFDTIMHKVAK